MDINAKIKLIAETMTGYSVVVDTSNGANVELSKITMPCILVFIQETGEFASNNSHYRDSVNIRVAFLNKMPKGFKESDVETMRYELKQDMVILYHKLKFDFQFKINNETVRYEIVYDEFDDNLLGVVFNDNIKERVGLNLACDVPDSHGELPSSPSFCQKVSECSSIISINEMLDSLQQQIDDLPTTTGVQSVTGPNVDNTDPFNPIVEPLGLIKIVDLNGELFTDLATAAAWIRTFINHTVYPITNESFDSGIFYFTVPSGTHVDLNAGFMSNCTASIYDELGLLIEFSDNSFNLNSGEIVLKNVSFQEYAFASSTGKATLNNITFIGATNYFAYGSTGIFILNGNIGADETANVSDFFTTATATILVPKEKYTSNAGGINGNLQSAITSGCNVQFDGIDLATIPNLALKSPIASPTFTGTVTTPTIIVSGATAHSTPIFNASKEIASSIMVDLSATLTIVGWSSFTTKKINKIDCGSYNLWDIHLDGTSNSTTTTVALSDNTNAASTIGYKAIVVVDNGGAVSATGVMTLTPSSNLVTFTRNLSQNTFTASGRKLVIAQFIQMK